MEIFRPYGVEHVVVLRKSSGNQAFVTFKSTEGAKQALATANVGIVCHKRKLRVLMADSWHSTKLIPPRPDVNPFPGINLRERISLPIECIAKISSYLPFADRSRLEMVSRRWRVGSLASYHGLRHIDLNDWCWPNGWEGKTVRDLPMTLTNLELHFCSFEEPIPEMEMEQGNEAVERGDFVELELGPVEMAVSFPSKYRHITTLSLTFCGWVASGLVSEIGLYMGEVISLNLSGCTNVKGEFVLEPLRKLQKLKILSINYMHPTVGGWVLQFLEGLLEVHCRESQGVTDEDICGLLRQCPELVTVDMESCPNISKTVLNCAYEVVTSGRRTGPIHLYTGGTTITRYTRYKCNNSLRVTHDLMYEPLFLSK